MNDKTIWDGPEAPDLGNIYVSRAEFDRYKKMAAHYEELRAVIDDGNEGMTHDDALCELVEMRRLLDEMETGL